jgi:hypothetical protein
MHRFSITILSLGLWFALLAAPAAVGQNYTVVDLGVLPGGTSSAGTGVNQSGQVSGSSNTSTSNGKRSSVADVHRTHAELFSTSGARWRKPKNEQHGLKGWQQTAAFLRQPISVAERWAKSGMPVTSKGRYMYASPEELNRWLGREAVSEPVQIATESADLAADLKRAANRSRGSPSRRKRRLAQIAKEGPASGNSYWRI